MSWSASMVVGIVTMATSMQAMQNKYLMIVYAVRFPPVLHRSENILYLSNAIMHGYNEFFYNEFMVITNQSLHPVVISVFHCSSFITRLWL